MCLKGSLARASVLRKGVVRSLSRPPRSLPPVGTCMVLRVPRCLSRKLHEYFTSAKISQLRPHYGLPSSFLTPNLPFHPLLVPSSGPALPQRPGSQLAIALEYKVPFCVCTCCFCSHPTLCNLLPEQGSVWETLCEAAATALAQHRGGDDAGSGVVGSAGRGSHGSQKRREPELTSSLARLFVLRACEREGARTTDAAEAAANAVSGGLWKSMFTCEATPQMKAMATVNALRLDAFHRRAERLSDVFYDTMIACFDPRVSSRNLALVGKVTLAASQPVPMPHPAPCGADIQ